MFTLLIPRFAIPAAALAFVTILSVNAARAEDTPPPGDKPAAAMEAHKDGPRGGMIPLDDTDLSKVEKMNPEQRKEFFKARKEEFKNMTPEQRKEMRDKRKAWFDSLSPEKKAELKERHQKMREEFRAQRKEAFDKLPPEKQAEIKAKHEARMDKMKARKQDKDAK